MHMSNSAEGNTVNKLHSVTSGGMSLLLLLLMVHPTLAKLPEPPNIFYGRASFNGRLLTARDTQMRISAKLGNELLASYIMGSNPAAQDRFVLAVPLDALGTRPTGTARPGQVITFYINDQEAGKVAVSERGTVVPLNLPVRPGDVNGDGGVNVSGLGRGDLAALIKEIFDSDDNTLANLHRGFPGQAGSDANTDGIVDAGDVSCAVLLAARGTCKRRGDDQSRPVLTLAKAVPASSGGLSTVPLAFAAKGAQISSLTVAVDYDATLLTFDPADANRDGLPDAITLHLPESFQVAVRFNANDKQGELDIALADVAVPLAALPDGPLLSIALRAAVVAEPTDVAVRVAAHPQVSLGSTQGYSVPATTRDGTVVIQPPVAHLVALPDVNRNRFAEVAVLLPDAATGQNSVYVNDGKTGRQLSLLTFLPSYTPLTLAALPDFDGNGVANDPVLAVLGQHDRTGAVKVQLRDVVRGTLLRTIALPTLSPIALTGLPDINGNAAADLAVLMHNPTAATNEVYVHDGGTGEALNTLPFLRAYTPLALAVLPDFNGNGVPTDPVLAVLGQQDGTGKVKVQWRNAVRGTLLRTVALPTLSPIALAGLPDINGNAAADLAVLMHNPTTATNEVYVHDGRTGEALNTLPFLRAYTPLALAVLPDVDGNGVPTDTVLAVLGQHDRTGEVKVQLRNAATDAPLPLVTLPRNQLPLGLAGIKHPQTTVGPELAVLGVELAAGAFHVHVHDATEGTQVRDLPVP
jgi:hypothetical protein